VITLIVWVSGTAFVLMFSLCTLLDPYRRNVHSTNVLAARGTLLCWAWPALLIYGLVFGVRYAWTIARQPIKREGNRYVP
jgi:predicted membrane protein